MILPTYNEQENIVALVDELRTRFLAGGHSYEIVVVDDRSPDGTGEIVATAFSDDPNVRLITRQQNPGLAYSIREGIERSRGATIVVMDTDFNHKPKDAVLLFEIARHVDLVVGSRFTFGGGDAQLDALLSELPLQHFPPPGARDANGRKSKRLVRNQAGVPVRT